MNERLRQFERESKLEIFGLGARRDKWEAALEKYAELIVAECVKFCEHESNDDEYDHYDMGMSVKAESIKIAIKQHFGVEE
jgi:hypothetical protein